MKRTAMALAPLLVLLAGTAYADMRGQAVCGVPPDEAALVVVEVSDRWLSYTPAGRSLNYTKTEEGSLWSWDAEYACEVAFLHGDTLRPQEVTGRFYRLNRPLVKSQPSGEVLADDFDVRERIIGAPREASTRPDWLGGKECVVIRLEESPARQGSRWWYSLSNPCDKEVWVALVERNTWGLEDKGFWALRRHASGPGSKIGTTYQDGEAVDTTVFIKLAPNFEAESWYGMHWEESLCDLPCPEVAFCLPGLEAVDPEKSDIRPGGGELFFSGESRCSGFPEKDENWHYVNFR